MHLLRTWRLTGLFAALAIGLVGCGEDPEPIPATIVSFEADATQIRTGTPVTFSWVTENATDLSLTYGDGLSVDLAGLELAAGEVEVLLDTAAEYTFTLTAQGKNGAAAVTATAAVSVQDPRDPVVDTFTAAPETITVGDSVTLTWATTDAASVVITEEGGDEVLNTSVEADGSIELTPTVDTTYTLTATGESGTTATATAAVTVLQLPIVDSFTATAGSAPVNQPVLSGTEVVLAWETTHVTEVTLSDSHGNNYPVTEVDGSITVTPSVTTTYTLGVTAPGGTDTADLTVDVLATISAFTIASTEGTGTDAVVRNGDEVTLSWATEGATSLTLTGPNGFSYSTTDPAEIAAGSVNDTPTASGSYDLVLEPIGSFSSDSVTVEVTDAPRIRTASVDTAMVTAGEPVNVTWTADGAETIVITATSGALDPVLVDTSAVTPAGDTVAVTLPAAGDWSIAIKAANSLTTETHTKNLSVQALAVPAVVAFDVQPRRTAPGGDVVLSWETVDAASVRLKKDGAEIAAFPSDQLSGTFTDTLTLTAAYVLEAQNSLGYVTASKAITVTAGAPEIVSFTSDLQYVAVNGTLNFSWQVEGGRSLSVTESGAELCSSTDYAEIASGGCAITTPAATGEYTYTLTVVDGAEQVTSTLTVQVSDGPIITDFYASSSIITAGSNVTLGIVVTADAAGTDPTLTLVDQDGTDYSSQVAYNAADDVWEITLTPADGADYLFTATAHTEGTTDSTATLALTVAPVPEVVSFTASNAQIDTISGPFDSTLAWETTGAVTLRVWELDADGLPTGTPLVDTSDAAAIASGSYVVSPSASTTYRVEAENLAGVLATDEVLVQVDLPLIGQFEFQDLDGNVIDKALIDQDVNLVWQTTRADTVSLSPTPWTITEVSGTRPFVDISTMAGAVEIGATILADDEDYGDTTVQFPAGFTFPYYGENETEFVVDVDGALSFDNDTGLSYNYHFGSSSYASGNLGIFWDDLVMDESPTTTVWTAPGTDPEHGDYFAVMFKNAHIDYSSASPSDLNFEVFLYANGNIEMRYGTMTSSDTGGERALGDSASVGFCDNTGDDCVDFHYNDLMAGGFANRSWFFDRQLAASDAKTLSFQEDATYTITAANANGEVSDSQTIAIWPDMALANPLFTYAPVPTQVGDETTFTFEVEGADFAHVLYNGTEVPGCSATDAGSRIVSATCTFVPDTAGTFDYVLEYSNPLSTNTKTLSVQVDPRLAIEDFTVTYDGATGSEAHIGMGDTATLSWTTTGASAIALLDSDFQPVLDPVPATGSISVTPDGTKTYQLYVSDTGDFGGRMQFAEVQVYVASVSVSELTASTVQAAPGSSVDLTWNTVGAESVVMAPMTWNMTTGNAFTSISSDPYARDISPKDPLDPTDDMDCETVVLDMSSKGFNFPFDGQSFNQFTISSNGWMQFGDTGESCQSSNLEIPYIPSSSYSSNIEHVFAPFWDDLHGKDADAKILYKMSGIPGQRKLVIEWYRFEKDSTTYTGVLTFQAVLHEQGTMEVRYVEVAADTLYDDSVDPPVVDDTATENNVDYYAGDSATVGWESLDETYGVKVLYNDPRPDVVASGNSLVFYPAEMGTSGTRNVRVERTTTYTVCATGGGWTDCEEVTVKVPQAGDFVFTEVMVDPVGTDDAAGQWFEIRNVSPYEWDLAGWTVSDDTGSYTIPAATPFPVSSGSYVVFSATDIATNGEVTGDLVYGADAPNLVLGTADSLALTTGSLTVDDVAWDYGDVAAGWTSVEGASMTLDPGLHFRTPDINDAWATSDGKAIWCTSTLSYGSSSLGSPGADSAGCRNDPYGVDLFGGTFIDIAATGTRATAVEGDSVYGQITGGLGFTTTFFDATVSNVWASSNGWISFSAPSSSDGGEDHFPHTNTPDNLIGVFWDDMDIRDDGISRALYETRTVSGQKVFIFQWENWERWYHAGQIDFQVQVWENGDIVLAYKDMSYDDVDDASYYNGDYASAGIENADGTVGLELFYHDPVVYDGFAVLYRKK